MLNKCVIYACNKICEEDSNVCKSCWDDNLKMLNTKQRSVCPNHMVHIRVGEEVLLDSNDCDLCKSGDSGVKHDSGKPQLSLLTRESLAAEARAFAYGAKKYDKNNYKLGMDWSRIIDALMRHTAAFNAKENLDPESGLCHLDHIKACAAMLVYYYENKIGKDDR